MVAKGNECIPNECRRSKRCALLRIPNRMMSGEIHKPIDQIGLTNIGSDRAQLFVRGQSRVGAHCLRSLSKCSVHITSLLIFMMRTRDRNQ